jgi:hypothetical protein
VKWEKIEIQGQFKVGQVITRFFLNWVKIREVHSTFRARWGKLRPVLKCNFEVGQAVLVGKYYSLLA